MNNCKRIFIIGHPGAGKALLGKTIAEKLGWKFIDGDSGLESHIGRSLNEILGNQGQEAFYHCQADILASLLRQENIVVATEAAIVCSEKNRHLLSSEFVVYLQVSTFMQIERTSRNWAPLLPLSDPGLFFDKLHNDRDRLYEQASCFTVNSDENALEEHVSAVIKIILNDSNIKSADTKSMLDKKDLVLFHKQRHVPVPLTVQQATCLKSLAQGKTSKIIAREMNISHRTVEGTIASVMELSGCLSSKELIALYHEKH